MHCLDLAIAPIHKRGCNHPLWFWQEIEKYKAALGKFYKTQGKVPLFFERNFKSSHTQLQTVAVDKSVAENCMTVSISSDRNEFSQYGVMLSIAV